MALLIEDLEGDDIPVPGAEPACNGGPGHTKPAGDGQAAGLAVKFVPPVVVGPLVTGLVRDGWRSSLRTRWAPTSGGPAAIERRISAS